MHRSVVFAIILLVFAAHSQDTVVGPTIVKYRELQVVFYGRTIDLVENNYYWMRVSINGISPVLTSPLAISNHIFRVDEEITDYLSAEQMDLVFSKDMKFKVEFFVKTDATQKFTAVEQTLNLFPDSEETLTVASNKYLAVEYATITLSCYGFTGYNCQYRAIDDPRLDTDFDSGDTKCKDATNCIDPDPECGPAGNGFCKHNGTCYMDQHLKKMYCRCPKGLGGEKCEIDYCAFDEDEKMFGERTDFCAITACSREENKCVNGGRCEKHGPSFIYCKCDTSSFSGKNCEKECTPACAITNEYCTYDPKDGVSFCYPLDRPMVINSKPKGNKQPLTASHPIRTTPFVVTSLCFICLLFTLLTLREILFCGTSWSLKNNVAKLLKTYQDFILINSQKYSKLACEVKHKASDINRFQ